MGIVIRQLQAIGPDLQPADLVFHPKRFLIRGPSETGKSYIRDCLWYLFGGDKQPKVFPLAEGYQELLLHFTHGNDEYEIRRALAGGPPAAFIRPANSPNETSYEEIEQDVGELLVRLAGAEGKQILRSMSDRGPVTGDDIRHWSLLSQTAILSEDATTGNGYGIPKRVASFNLFLSGNDDAAIQLRKSNAEVERIKGQLTSAEDALRRIKAGLPLEVTRDEVADSLERVDAVLTAMTNQYEARAAKLRGLRKDISEATDALAKCANEAGHSASMIARFELLDQKYANDIGRLGATNEGIAFFQELPETPCPLCGSQIEELVTSADLHPKASATYRVAIAAELAKVKGLQVGLQEALTSERRRYGDLRRLAQELTDQLDSLQKQEALVLNEARIEFSADPKSMAVRRSELSAQLGIFDEMERLLGEIDRLKKSKVRTKVQVSRDGGTNGRAVADLALLYLRAWGFDDIKNISLDAEQCDLILDDRPRLSYGAGRRALYLAALIIALMEHALSSKHPHLGVVVIDSPLKAYADPNSEESKSDIPLITVTDKFYDWLSKWNGLGQIVILENEKLSLETAERLKPVEFSGVPGEGRSGFYPYRITVSPSPAENANDTDA